MAVFWIPVMRPESNFSTNYNYSAAHDYPAAGGEGLIPNFYTTESALDYMDS